MSATLTVDTPSRPAMSPLVAEMRDAAPAFFAIGLVLVAAIVPTIAAYAFDARQLLGANVWLKPFKFELSLALYVFTLAFFARYAAPAIMASRAMRIYAGLVVAAIVIEMVWLVAAASLGVPSHYNTSPIGRFVYPLMGVVAIFLTTASAVVGVLVWRAADARLSPALREAVALGLVLTLPATIVAAGALASGPGHIVGGTEGVGGLIFGWSRDGGDLRVAHFLATHLMHLVPLAGLAIVWIAGGRAVWAVRGAAVLLVALVGLTLAQALAGRPFLPMLPL